MKIFRRAKNDGGRNDGKSLANRMVTEFFHALTLSEVMPSLYNDLGNVKNQI